MGQPFPTQHPAVVLRSHFTLVRALLAMAMIAVVALSATVVIVASDNEVSVQSSTPSAELPPLPNTAVHAHPLNRPATRYDGGPEEGTRSIGAVPAPSAGARYDGGPEEGTRGAVTIPQGPGARYDGGPEEGTRGPVTIPQGPGARYDGGPEEGTRGIR